MDVIFDLQKENSDWASEINEGLQSTFPEYFTNSPAVGSNEWWQALFPDISKGKITHVGPMMEDGELLDVISIQPLDEDLNGAPPGAIGPPEFLLERDDYWLSEHVSEGKYVQTESITILPTGELDEHSIYIETKVSIW